MESLQWNLEQLFCPLIDSTLIAAIVNDNPDFESCFEILSSLAEATSEEDIENELSSGNSNNFISSSSGEPGDGSTTSIGVSTDGRSVEDELDYLSTDYEYDYENSKGKFLKNMFPSLSEARVDTLLSENDNNVEMAVDVILNEMYLETEHQDNDFSYSDNSLITDARFKHRKTKRLRKQQRKQNKIIFQNSGHRPNSNNSSSATLGPLTSPSSSSSSSSSSTSSYWTSSPRNPWNKFDYESRDGLIDDDKLCQLMSIFPDHNFESLKQTLVKCNGEVQNAIVTLSSGVLNGDKRQQKKATNQPYHTSEHQNIYLHNKERDGSIQNCTIYSDNYGTQINKIYDDDETVDYRDDYDPDYCQDEAFKCYKKRDESFKKAADYYQRGQGGAASYHSEEGWKFDAEMKTWKLRAARSLVKKHRNKLIEKSKYEHILDLHGCFVTEAIIIVKEWLNDWYPKRMRSDSQLKPLKIITGKGNHSPDGIAKLPNAINKFLINDNWDITKHRGYVLVHGLKNNP